MESPERGADQDARLAALQAFIQTVEGDVNTAVSLLGDLNDPVRFSSALALLNQNDRFEDAVDLAAGRPISLQVGRSGGILLRCHTEI
jgi:hypothetical protein